MGCWLSFPLLRFSGIYIYTYHIYTYIHINISYIYTHKHIIYIYRCIYIYIHIIYTHYIHIEYLYLCHVSSFGDSKAPHFALWQALSEWNTLQATLRQASTKISDSLLVIGFCCLASMALLGEQVIRNPRSFVETPGTVKKCQEMSRHVKKCQEMSRILTPVSQFLNQRLWAHDMQTCATGGAL